MTTDVKGEPAARPPVNPWLIALTVTLATFMEVLDTSIANVALPHMAGSLSVSVHESTWVLTSYLVANAVILPLSGWLSSIIGRKRFYHLLRRAVHGQLGTLRHGCEHRATGALPGPSGPGRRRPAAVRAGHSHGHLPTRQARGMAMAVYTLAILVAPVLGPTLGGYITENYSWRWIFYINLPVGVISVLL